jgi:hypothetical protein
MQIGSRMLACALLLVAPGCAQDDNRPPVARLSVSPRYVPVGQETVLTLDGRRSCDEIDYPESCDKTAEGSGPPLTCPGGLSYAWSMDVPFTPVDGASLTAPRLDVRVTLDRPATVKLTVTDCDQRAVTTQTQVGITLPYPDADAGVP